MGKPTIATQTPTMEIFKDYVYLGRTATDYINLIEKALKEDSPEKHKSVSILRQVILGKIMFKKSIRQFN
jgi:hypothetical protein